MPAAFPGRTFPSAPGGGIREPLHPGGNQRGLREPRGAPSPQAATVPSPEEGAFPLILPRGRLLGAQEEGVAWEPGRRWRGAASERPEMAGRQVEQVNKPTHPGLGHRGSVSRAVASWGVEGLRPGLGNPRAPGRTERMGRAPRHPPPESMENRPPSPRIPRAPNPLWALQTALWPPILHPGALAPWRAEHAAARGEASPLATPSIPAVVQGGPGGADRPGAQGSDSGCPFPQR